MTSKAEDADRPPRGNEAWIEALRGHGEDPRRAILELEVRLRRVLAKVFSTPSGREDLADLVQEAMVRIMKSLDSFRGDSAFTTWATSIALRVGYTELRRRKVRALGRDAFREIEEEALERACSRTRTAESTMARRQLHDALEQAIAESLTDRQRSAILAELRGLPTVEIAERLGITQNALYKLVHDARIKLRRALHKAGFTADSIREHLEESRT